MNEHMKRIVDELQPEFKKLGYKKSGGNFYKTENGFYKLVNFQGSQYGHCFYVNVALNPEGFTYSEDYLEQDIWKQAEPKDDWFVRGYSIIDEMEDRATVIEAIFRYNDDWWAAHPHIEKKRDFLLDAAEPVFGPVYYHE